MQTQHAHVPWFAGVELLRRRLDAISARKARRTGAEAATVVRAPGILRGLAACGAIVGLGVANVLVPAMSPLGPEAARLEQAQQIQRLATLWQLENHPRDDALYLYPAFPPPTERFRLLASEETGFAGEAIGGGAGEGSGASLIASM